MLRRSSQKKKRLKLMTEPTRLSENDLVNIVACIAVTLNEGNLEAEERKQLEDLEERIINADYLVLFPLED